jgi:phosphoribosyl-ATP pyrophosphohydrolase
MRTQGFSLDDLEAIVAARAAAGDGTSSHTARLLAGGVALAAKKFGEEAVETVIAALSGDDRQLVAESADALYHLLVVLKARDVPLRDVMAELARRTGESGLAEKARRSGGP